MTTIIWYLILTSSHGGMLAVPQPDHTRCTEQASYLNVHSGDGGYGDETHAYCVQGLK
jgi:hypothetical protein